MFCPSVLGPAHASQSRTPKKRGDLYGCKRVTTERHRTNDFIVAGDSGEVLLLWRGYELTLSSNWRDRPGVIAIPAYLN
jgi:hypothetical protein